MNYLASKGLNSQSFLTYSVHGDDRNVSPYIDSEDRTRISVAKMAQWEIVFEHMERLGLFMEFKLMEIENDWDMDAGELGPERRLYYRELIARFAHHLGFYWNVGEENDNTPAAAEGVRPIHRGHRRVQAPHRDPQHRELGAAVPAADGQGIGLQGCVAADRPVRRLRRDALPAHGRRCGRRAVGHLSRRDPSRSGGHGARARRTPRCRATSRTPGTTKAARARSGRTSWPAAPA